MRALYIYFVYLLYYLLSLSLSIELSVIMLLGVTIVDALSYWVHLFNDNPGDIPIDRSVLNNDEEQRHYRWRNSSDKIEVVWRHLKIKKNNEVQSPHIICI